MTIGKASDMRRPTATAEAVYSVFATSKRSRSLPSRTKARTTRTPVICSRRIRLTVSTLVCMRRKLGIIARITRPTDTASSGTATATSQLRPMSSRRAMITPPIIIIGAVTIIVSAMLVTVCTWVTSLVVREMSVGAPKRATSWALKLPTREKTAARSRAAIVADRPAPIHVAAMVATIWTTETASMTPPWRTM